MGAFFYSSLPLSLFRDTFGYLSASSDSLLWPNTPDGFIITVYYRLPLTPIVGSNSSLSYDFSKGLFSFFGAGFA
jgi:hypothetical protein